MSHSPPPAAGELRLEQLQAEDAFSVLDVQFARRIARLASATSLEEQLALAVASRAVQMGHVCVTREDLARVLAQVAEHAEPGPVHLPSAQDIFAQLTDSPLCSASLDSDITRPLVLLDGRRLYLQKYASYEASVASNLRRRARPVEGVDLGLLEHGCQRLFPQPKPTKGLARPELDRQRLAAAVTVRHHLAIICGGPGTGKTTTVARTLCLLQEQALQQRGTPYDILLLAPTGKAAQRLSESLESALSRIDTEERVRASLPREAWTIHRALGGSRRAARFRHDADNPLTADVVLVDEVSMVDLVLLYRLLSAVRSDARLILQGDKDQLASVEAGAILGDIFEARQAVTFSRAFLNEVGLSEFGLSETVEGDSKGGPSQEAPELAAVARRGLWDSLTWLSRSHRYSSDSGIGRLARSIHAGDSQAALDLLDSAPPDCSFLSPTEGQSQWAHLSAELRPIALSEYGPLSSAAPPEERLGVLSAYRVLSARRKGPGGVEWLNQWIERWLRQAGLIRMPGPYWEGRPILVTQNDYALGLFNGDVGLISYQGSRYPRAYFETSSGVRVVAAARLPAHETVYAMTIHKSQGSEFVRTSVVLPQSSSRMVGRELVYTAITRSRERLDVIGSRVDLARSMERPVIRASGLHQALWG